MACADAPNGGGGSNPIAERWLEAGHIARGAAQDNPSIWGGCPSTRPEPSTTPHHLFFFLALFFSLNFGFYFSKNLKIYYFVNMWHVMWQNNLREINLDRGGRTTTPLLRWRCLHLLLIFLIIF